MFRPRKELSNPDLRRLIVKLRNSGCSWQFIVDKVKEKFNEKISLPTAQAIFEKEIAHAVTKSPIARDQFKSDYQKVHQRYDRVCNSTDSLLDEILRLRDELLKEGLDTKQRLDFAIKYCPLIIALQREVIAQLEFLKKEQERITINQKNIIYSPIQINMMINKMVKKLAGEGYIRILKNLPLSKEEDEEDEEEEKEKKKKKEEIPAE